MADTLVELINEGKDITEHLTDSERDRFEASESVIHKGLRTFIEVGRALADIKNSRLYREAYPGYTFEKYCKEVWDLSRGHANRQIDSYQVIQNLKSKCLQLETFSENAPEQTQDQEEKCTGCPHRKALANTKYKGVKIPNEHGKCTRPEEIGRASCRETV